MTLRVCLLVVSLLVGQALAADTIRLADGKAIENVQVLSEGLKEVTYKEGKSDRTVAADEVVSVHYEKRPPQLDEAEEALLQEDPEGAVGVLEAFVHTALDKPQSVREFKWAPALAAWRAVEVRLGAADLEGAKTAAALVIQSFGESRFVPHAYVAKATAELDAGQADQARATLGELSALVSSKSLSKRWELEVRLGLAQSDAQARPATRRAELEKIVGEAGAFPVLRSLAKVKVAETYLAEAAASSSSAKGLREKAKEGFEAVLADESASRLAVALAHAGRGESLFLMGADADDKAQLQAAALEFLRVTTLYRDQGIVVAKALFYAMRCFDLLPDPRRKADMKRELASLYSGTAWAAESRKY